MTFAHGKAVVSFKGKHQVNCGENRVRRSSGLSPVVRKFVVATLKTAPTLKPAGLRKRLNAAGACAISLDFY